LCGDSGLSATRFVGGAVQLSLGGRRDTSSSARSGPPGGGTDHSLEAFRPLLDGTTNWAAVVEALDQTGYRGHLTFEYFHPYLHYPEALVQQTSDSLDRMLGRK